MENEILNEIISDTANNSIPQYISIAIKLLVGFFEGLILGLERKIRQQAIGMRTVIIITVASSLVMIVSIYLGETHGTDPARIAAQVVSGIGFLGGGCAGIVPARPVQQYVAGTELGKHPRGGLLAGLALQHIAGECLGDAALGAYFIGDLTRRRLVDVKQSDRSSGTCQDLGKISAQHAAGSCNYGNLAAKIGIQYVLHHFL